MRGDGTDRTTGERHRMIALTLVVFGIPTLIFIVLAGIDYLLTHTCKG